MAFRDELRRAGVDHPARLPCSVNTMRLLLGGGKTDPGAPRRSAMSR